MISCELTEANHLKHFKVQKTCDFLLKYDQFHINLFTEILCTEWPYFSTNNFKAICTFKFGIVFQVHATSLQLHILIHLPNFPESLTHHLVSLNKYKWPMYKQEVLFSFTKDANCNNKYFFSQTSSCQQGIYAILKHVNNFPQYATYFCFTTQGQQMEGTVTLKNLYKKRCTCS